jgi:hypothetical protein
MWVDCIASTPHKHKAMQAKIGTDEKLLSLMTMFTLCLFIYSPCGKFLF